MGERRRGLMRVLRTAKIPPKPMPAHHDLALSPLARSYSSNDTVRVDIWLWRARFFKSRALSARNIKRGHIRLLRGEQTMRMSKPHTKIWPGDVLVFMRDHALHQIQVRQIGQRRGPAGEARGLYQNVTPAPKPLSTQPLTLSKTA